MALSASYFFVFVVSAITILQVVCADEYVVQLPSHYAI